MNGLTKRILATFLALTFLIVGATGSTAAQSSPAVGYAENTLTLLSFTGPQSINLGLGSGSASTDPASHPVATALATLIAAQIGSTTHEGYSAAASYDSDPSKRSSGSSLLPPVNVAVPGVASLSLKAEGVSASTPDNLSAFSSILKADLDADLLAGLVKLTDISIDISDESKVSDARASQGVSIGKIELVPLSKILDLLLLSLDDLLELADIADPTGSLGNTVGEARADLLAALNEFLADPAVCAAVQAVLPGAQCSVATDVSGQDLMALAEAAASVEMTLPTCAIADVCPINDGLDALNNALSDLRDLLAPLSLLTIEGLSSGVSASATDASSAASATLADLGTVKVLGSTIPVAGTVEQKLAAMTTALEGVVDQLNDIAALAGLSVSLNVPAATISVVPEGDYQVGRATISALSVQLANTGLTEASIPLSMGVNVLSLNSVAKHKPAVASVPSPEGPLASTGESSLWAIAGFIFIALALRLRRWLGDAA